MELFKLFALLHCSLYTCNHLSLAVRELSIIKPPNKLMKLRGNWEDGVVWSCVKKPAKHLENKLLIYQRLSKAWCLCCSLC